ncbi:hypothetical protein BDV37DRAFT_219541 [Aspergillus pseudonomiae]|uniref:Uncharacterized protein n=1 Tax=Aspergillus pseudonomiae TaxID=1506151 RepID=A0A5N7D0V4_9EURO|nr:uncharacterized protein BDV37DRAFT_219541 [Aspergillus pseudonomiae]KAE8399849.1 hypothetical protein BDV37DRAFT_219541 [Aspergillus pseudonomiae]
MSSALTTSCHYCHALGYKVHSPLLSTRRIIQLHPSVRKEQQLCERKRRRQTPSPSAQINAEVQRSLIFRSPARLHLAVLPKLGHCCAINLYSLQRSTQGGSRILEWLHSPGVESSPSPASIAVDGFNFHAVSMLSGPSHQHEEHRMVLTNPFS